MNVSVPAAELPSAVATVKLVDAVLAETYSDAALPISVAAEAFVGVNLIMDDADVAACVTAVVAALESVNVPSVVGLRTPPP